MMQAAAARLGRECTVVSWQRVLAELADSEIYGSPSEALGALPEIPANTLVRVESPGQCFEVEKQILALGAHVAETSGDEFPSYSFPPRPFKPRSTPYRRIASADISALREDRGIIHPMRQWYLGWCRALRFLEEELAPRGVRWMNPPADIAMMFDKSACHHQLAAHSLPVP